MVEVLTRGNARPAGLFSKTAGSYKRILHALRAGLSSIGSDNR